MGSSVTRSEMNKHGLPPMADAHVRRLHYFEGAGAVLSSATRELQADYLAQDRRDHVREADDVVACVPLSRRLYGPDGLQTPGRAHLAPEAAGS